MASSRKIVLFDGVCNLCDAFVNFVYAHDSRKTLFFAPQQSQTGRDLLHKYNLSLDLTTVFFVDEAESHAYSHSGAVLRICSYLDKPWHLLGYFLWVPEFIRDVCYSMVSQSRYTVFGKHNGVCAYQPGLRRQFLDLGEQKDFEEENYSKDKV